MKTEYRTNTYPKVLVLSNEGFSKENSNGRTLGNFFLDWPKEKLAQVYTNYTNLDLVDCRYFYISDRSVLKDFFSFRSSGTQMDFESGEEPESDELRKKHERTPFNVMLRNFIWDYSWLKQKKLRKFIDDFSPDIVLLQIGSASFMLKLALRISKYADAKLGIFSTEGYYFFNFNFYNWKPSLLIKPIHWRYQRLYKKVCKKSSVVIYNCDLLKNDFDKALYTNSQVLYCSSSEISEKSIRGDGTIVYAGGQYIGRYKTLAELAKAINEKKIPLKVISYGRLSEIALNALREQNVLCPGFVDYQKIQKAIRYCSLVIHVEPLNLDKNRERYMRYAFSTKIADCLASGKPFLVIAPDEIAFMRYLRENDCAFLANNIKEAEEFIENIFPNDELLEKKVTKALWIARKNHDIDLNKEKMRDILLSAVQGGR